MITPDALEKLLLSLRLANASVEELLACVRTLCPEPGTAILALRLAMLTIDREHILVNPGAPSLITSMTALEASGFLGAHFETRPKKET